MISRLALVVCAATMLVATVDAQQRYDRASPFTFSPAETSPSSACRFRQGSYSTVMSNETLSINLTNFVSPVDRLIVATFQPSEHCSQEDGLLRDGRPSDVDVLGRRRPPVLLLERPEEIFGCSPSVVLARVGRFPLEDRLGRSSPPSPSLRRRRPSSSLEGDLLDLL